MRVERFSFDLPPELIAQEPASDREEARLLVVPRQGGCEHAHIRDLPERVPEGALVVLNDTKVIRARIVGTKEGTGGRAEVFLLRKLDQSDGVQRWQAMARASKALRPGARVIKDEIAIEFEGKCAEGLYVVSVRRAGPPSKRPSHARVRSHFRLTSNAIHTARTKSATRPSSQRRRAPSLRRRRAFI